MAKQLRAAKRVPSYSDLVNNVAAEIVELGYKQQPQILGPKAILSNPIPLQRRAAR